MNDRSTITILLHDTPREVAEGCTLLALLEQLGHAPQSVATAVNGRFVARTQRAAWVLQPSDAVLLFQPIVGG